jgi:hypothetical protein
MIAADIFKSCVESIRKGELIEREGVNDKEFHFQNWFKRRLASMRLNFDQPGRNSYPDFRLVNSPEGYELKGLAYPGRDASYDCNSQMPRGEHNGRQVYYVFGRYPKKPDGDRSPVLDLVLCHGSFLNADNAYEHKNKSFRGIGSYGDILVRDRKMYVAPTPFALAEGTAHHRTLIVPVAETPGAGFSAVGTLTRREVENLVIAYEFDLRKNELRTTTAPNPSAGREHIFAAYRLTGDPTEPVALRSREKVLQELKAVDAALSDDEED